MAVSKVITVVCKTTPYAIDRFTNKLWDEEMHYLTHMTTPSLWSEKKKKHIEDRNRHLKNKRLTLKDITGSRTIAHHSSFTTTTTTTTNSVCLVDEPIAYEPVITTISPQRRQRMSLPFWERSPYLVRRSNSHCLFLVSHYTHPHSEMAGKSEMKRLACVSN